MSSPLDLWGRLDARGPSSSASAHPLWGCEGYRSIAGHPLVTVNLQYRGKVCMPQIEPDDIATLRRELADQLEAQPVREWSAPLLMAIIGILEANALQRQLSLRAREVRRRSRLHIVR